MKIAVTGATGFLGYYVCQKISESGCQVVKFNSRNFDIREPVELPNVDVVIHLAANSKVYLARKHVFEDFRINGLGTLHLLEAMRKSGVKKIIYISSTRVYKNQINAREEDPVGMNSAGGPYGLSKLIGEFYVQEYANSYNLDYVIFRLSGLYGPRMYKNPLFDIIRGFMNNETIKLYQHISSEMDFIYAKDAAEGISKGLEWNNEILNLSSGTGYKLIDIYDILKNMFNIEPPLEYGKEHICMTANNDRIKSLGWNPRYSIEEGLQETVGFFKNGGINN